MFNTIKAFFTFRKEDLLMWVGVAIFSLVILIAMIVISSDALMVFKDLIGMSVVLILPGYVIVKLYLDDLQVSENMTKNPDINKAIDKVIISLGCGIATIIPLNFIWNYLITMWGNVDEEMIYLGSAGLRSILTVIVVIGAAIGYKVYQAKQKESAES